MPTKSNPPDMMYQVSKDASQSHLKNLKLMGKTWKSAYIWTKTAKNGLKINENM